MSSLSGYSNNGFTKSLNGITTLSDGAGSTIQDGEISTVHLTLSEI
jgi:hypothetical protein